MNAIRNLAFACAIAVIAAPALAQSVKIKQGMLNVPALSPLWLLPDEAKKQGIEIEMVMFQRFADARTALASGDIQLTAFGPQDISLALGAGAKSLVGVAGVGSGNDCLIVRKGEDIKNWKEVQDKRIGIGAGSISWLKFAASVQENGLQYNKLKIVNIVGGGSNYLKALQGKEIDMAVVWHPFCAQAIVEGFGAYPDARPQPLEDRRRPDLGAGGEPAVHGEKPGRGAEARQLVRERAGARAQGHGTLGQDLRREGRPAGERGGGVDPHHAARPDPAAGVDQAHLEVPFRQRRDHARRLRRDRAALHLRLPRQGDGQVAGAAGHKAISC
jgi:hypothetical protein